MLRPAICLSTFATASAITIAALTAEPSADSWQSAAQKLQQSTATLRIWSPTPYSPLPTPSSVSVSSALCIRDGLLITAAIPGSDSPIRLTLPGGKQSDAKVFVIDEYSGLALLKADTSPLVPLIPADSTPATGADFLTAAAWGLEQPLVSRGIIGGIDRIYPGTNYPPLLQCDCIPASTSTGAGLVDRQGRLLGIIAATDREADRRGWTYAVPVAHVQRLLRSADEHKSDGVLILKRRRPLVGMVLDQEDDAIIVSRVIPGGPAEKSGIKPGDQIFTTDGVAIRSVYQAVLPTQHKQPGDTTTFRIYRDGTSHDITVTLGGGVELDSAPTDLLANLIQPKILLRRDPNGAIVTSRGPSISPAVSVLPPLPNDAPPSTSSTPADKIALLEKALTRYQAVIELQQKQLAAFQAELNTLRAK